MDHKEGRRREGSRWEKASLRKLLTNPVYVGSVSYRGATYPGEHPGIVDADAFGRVAEMLGEGRADPRRSGNKYGSCYVGWTAASPAAPR
ncbi:MAG TPA: recombinase family protein [Myxococcales bacterium]